MPRERRPPGAAKTPLQQFGAELRHRRELLGLSVSELAAAVGKDRRTITGAEDGRDCPSAATVHKLEMCLQGEGLLTSYYEAVVASRRNERLHLSDVHNGMAPDATMTDASEFLGETIPDGTIMPPGQRFEKTWTIRNAGTVAWSDRRLTRMGIASGPGLITTPAFVILPPTLPGEELTIRVPCVGQFVQGTSLAAFKMTDSEKRLYFPYSRYTVGLQLQITVVDRAW